MELIYKPDKNKDGFAGPRVTQDIEFAVRMAIAVGMEKSVATIMGRLIEVLHENGHLSNHDLQYVLGDDLWEVKS